VLLDFSYLQLDYLILNSILQKIIVCQFHITTFSFQQLTLTAQWIFMFWTTGVVTPCDLVSEHQRFGETCHLDFTNKP